MFSFLQEVGGSYDAGDQTYHHVEFLPSLGHEYEAFVYHPPACFCKVAVVLRRDLVAQISAFHTLEAGLLLRLRVTGSMLFVASLHLPHFLKTLL